MVAKHYTDQTPCCEAKTLMAMKKSKKPMIKGSSAELSPVDARLVIQTSTWRRFPGRRNDPGDIFNDPVGQEQFRSK